LRPLRTRHKKTFEDAGGEENGPDLSGKIDWFSEFVDGNDGAGTAKHVYYDQDQLKRKKSYC